MKPLIWGNEYNINIPEIDEQHREFVHIINKLCWAEDHDYSIAMGTRLLIELVKYAEFHFVCEENLMFFHQYSGLPGQMNEHKKLLGIMELKSREFQSGIISYEAVIKFAFLWLITHTNDEDKKFGEFYCKKNG